MKRIVIGSGTRFRIGRAAATFWLEKQWFWFCSIVRTSAHRMAEEESVDWPNSMRSGSVICIWIIAPLGVISVWIELAPQTEGGKSRSILAVGNRKSPESIDESNTTDCSRSLSDRVQEVSDDNAGFEMIPGSGPDFFHPHSRKLAIRLTE